MDSKELFNVIKNNQVRFDEVLRKQNEFWNKLSNVKIGKETTEQKNIIGNLEKFYLFGEEFINFSRDYSTMTLDAGNKAKQDKQQEQDLKH